MEKGLAEGVKYRDEWKQVRGLAVISGRSFGAGGGGHESCVPGGCEEIYFFWKNMAVKHECEELKEGVLAGTNPGDAAKEDQRIVDG